MPASSGPPSRKAARRTAARRAATHAAGSGPKRSGGTREEAGAMAPERGLGPKRRNRETGTPAWMGLRARRGPGGLHAAGPRSAARPPRGRVRVAVRRILGQRRPQGGAEAFPPPVRRNAAFLCPREMDLGADARNGFADSAATARTAGAGASIAHQAADNVWSHPPAAAWRIGGGWGIMHESPRKSRSAFPRAAAGADPGAIPGHPPVQPIQIR